MGRELHAGEELSLLNATELAPVGKAAGDVFEEVDRLLDAVDLRLLAAPPKRLARTVSAPNPTSGTGPAAADAPMRGPCEAEPAMRPAPAAACCSTPLPVWRAAPGDRPAADTAPLVVATAPPAAVGLGGGWGPDADVSAPGGVGDDDLLIAGLAALWADDDRRERRRRSSGGDAAPPAPDTPLSTGEMRLLNLLLDEPLTPETPRSPAAGGGPRFCRAKLRAKRHSGACAAAVAAGGGAAVAGGGGCECGKHEEEEEEEEEGQEDGDSCCSGAAPNLAGAAAAPAHHRHHAASRGGAAGRARGYRRYHAPAAGAAAAAAAAAAAHHRHAAAAAAPPRTASLPAAPLFRTPGSGMFCRPAPGVSAGGAAPFDVCYPPQIEDMMIIM